MRIVCTARTKYRLRLTHSQSVLLFFFSSSVASWAEKRVRWKSMSCCLEKWTCLRIKKKKKKIVTCCMTSRRVTFFVYLGSFLFFFTSPLLDMTLRWMRYCGLIGLVDREIFKVFFGEKVILSIRQSSKVSKDQEWVICWVSSNIMIYK